MSPAFTLKFNSNDGTGFSLDCPDIGNSTFSFDFTANNDGTVNHKIKIKENKPKEVYNSASPSSNDGSTTDMPATPESEGRGGIPLVYDDADLTFGSMSREQWEQEFKSMFVATAVKRKISELEEEDDQESPEHEQQDQESEPQVQSQDERAQVQAQDQDQGEQEPECEEEQVSTTEEEDEAIYFNGLEGAGNQLEDGTGTLPDIEEEEDDHDSQNGQVTPYVHPADNEFDIRELDNMF